MGTKIAKIHYTQQERSTRMQPTARTTTTRPATHRSKTSLQQTKHPQKKTCHAVTAHVTQLRTQVTTRSAHSDRSRNVVHTRVHLVDEVADGAVQLHRDLCRRHVALAVQSHGAVTRAPQAPSTGAPLHHHGRPHGGRGGAPSRTAVSQRPCRRCTVQQRRPIRRQEGSSRRRQGVAATAGCWRRQQRRRRRRR